MSRLPEPARAIGVMLLILLTPMAAADSGLLNGTLGRWLDTEVLPELGRTLGEHPRFKGETIKLVSLDGGQPADRASRLHEAVEAHLTLRLLETSGVRIAWSDQPLNRCGIDLPPAYLLGVEIDPDGSAYHRLNIRMIDVSESVWVSGISHSWRGRLTAAESAALRQSVTRAAAGSVDSPLPVRSGREIAKILRRHLNCAHPQGLDGPVYIAQGENADLNRILASLRTELATTPIAALSSDEDGAAWVLDLDSAAAGTGNQVQQLGLMLTQRSRGATQQVATVYVSGARSRPSPSTDEIANAPPSHPAVPAGALITDLRLYPAEDEGICDTGAARGNQCAEVGFELLTPAYLFVLSSSSRRLSTTACDRSLVEASAGERRFRIRVPPSPGNLPDAGLYAIAVHDRTAAKKLARHIRTGVCSRPLNRSESWLAELDAMLADGGTAVQWRAIHLTHTMNGVERL